MGCVGTAGMAGVAGVAGAYSASGGSVAERAMVGVREAARKPPSSSSTLADRPDTTTHSSTMHALIQYLMVYCICDTIASPQYGVNI